MKLPIRILDTLVYWVQEPSVAEITAGGFVLDDGSIYKIPEDMITRVGKKRLG